MFDNFFFTKCWPLHNKDLFLLLSPKINFLYCFSASNYYVYWNWYHWLLLNLQLVLHEMLCLMQVIYVFTKPHIWNKPLWRHMHFLSRFQETTSVHINQCYIKSSWKQQCEMCQIGTQVTEGGKDGRNSLSLHDDCYCIQSRKQVETT